MGKRLIINADDFGLTDGINRGIMDCLEKGIVTGMSIVAGGEGYQDAVQLAQKKGIFRVGAHLAVTGPFRPVSRPNEIPTLLTNEAKFCEGYMRFLARYFSGKINLDELYVEFKNQLERIKNDGFEVTHLDSHHHIHMMPDVLRVLVKIAEEERIGYIRFSSEKKLVKAGLLDVRNRTRRAMLLQMCKMSRPIMANGRIKHNDHFFGHFHAHSLNGDILSAIISNLEDGLTEICCHPGYLTYDVKTRYRCHSNCENELDALCDPAIKLQLKNLNIELVEP